MACLVEWESNQWFAKPPRNSASVAPLKVFPSSRRCYELVSLWKSCLASHEHVKCISHCYRWEIDVAGSTVASQRGTYFIQWQVFIDSVERSIPWLGDTTLCQLTLRAKVPASNFSNSWMKEMHCSYRPWNERTPLRWRGYADQDHPGKDHAKSQHALCIASLIRNTPSWSGEAKRHAGADAKLCVVCLASSTLT